MSTDLEDRLCTMYAAVADTTEVRDDLLATVHEAGAPRPSIGRRRTVALLAVAAVLVAGLVDVVTHRRSTPPSTSLKDRPFAVATWVPAGFAFSDATPDVQPRTGLRGFGGQPTGASFATYSGPSSHQIAVSTARAGAGAPSMGTRTATLSSGAIAQVTRDTEFVTVAWVQPGGYATSVYGQGITDDEAIAIADDIWYVTGSMWQRLTAKAGFQELQLDAWNPPSDGGDPLTFHMVGSLQRGFELSSGSLGFSFGPSGAQGCRPQWLGRSDSDQQVVLRSFRAVERFRVTLPDGTTRDIAAQMPPGVPAMRVAIAVINAPKSYLNGNVPVQCLGGGA